MDDNGFPNNKVSVVAEGGSEEIAIKAEHHILASGNNLEGKHYVNACAEIPSTDICDKCYVKYICNFSEARGRWR